MALTFYRPVVTGLQRVPWSWIFLTQLSWTILDFNERLSLTALPFTIRKFTDDPRLIAVLLSFNFVFNIVVGVTVNYISDRIWTRFGRRRPFIILGWAGSALALLTLPLAPSLPWLTLNIVVFEFCKDLVSPNGPLSLEIVPAPQRGRAAAVRSILQNVVQIYYFQLLFAMFDGQHVMDLGWLGTWTVGGEQLTYWAVAALTLGLAIYMAINVRETPRQAMPGPKFSLRQFFVETFGPRVWLMLYLMILASLLLTHARGPFWILMQHDQFGYSKADLALMALPTPILQVVLLAPLLGWLVDNAQRIPLAGALAVLGASVGAFAGLLLFAYTGPWDRLPSLAWLVGLSLPLDVMAVALLAVVFALLHPRLRTTQPRLTLIIAAVGLQVVQIALQWWYVVAVAERQPPIGIWFLLSSCSGVFVQAMNLVVWVLVFDFVPADRLGTVSSGMSLVSAVARFLLHNVAGFLCYYVGRWFLAQDGNDYTTSYFVQFGAALGALALVLYFTREVRMGRLVPHATKPQPALCQ